MLDLDRVLTVAFIIENTQKRKTYYYGTSLTAGFRNFFEFMKTRFLGLPSTEQKYFLESHDYINRWRFGTHLTRGIGGSRPPSYPGEFFMQGGYFSLILLSIAFGVFFQWLRKRTATTQSLLGKWFFIYITTFIAFFSTALVSVIIKTLYVPVIPLLILYSLAYFTSNFNQVREPINLPNSINS